jgi:hypothetical protein
MGGGEERIVPVAKLINFFVVRNFPRMKNGGGVKQRMQRKEPRLSDTI